MSDYNQEDFWALQEENERLRNAFKSLVSAANLAGNGLLNAVAVKEICKDALGDE